MKHQVLARKWRPRSLQTMVGQEHVLRMLTNALDHERLHHAYLFTGTRGVGKTSIARILAKCLNCETGISSKPCNECNACQAIDAGRFLDLIEVDAASRTKVEDTREILDNVQYAPSQGRFKIYLIDEVHMLSGHSFNALLKTLEEPPAHVKFLLATTDPKRLPITILSRCLQFNLKRVPITQITQHLVHICQTENITFEQSALELLAQAADGSLRDALSLLDQTIAYCSENITCANTREMLGSIEQDVIFRLLDALVEQNGKKLLAEIAQLADFAPDFNQVLEDLLSILHLINVAQIVPSASAQHAAQIVQIASRLTPEETQLFYQIALLGRRDLPLAPNPLHGFEMVMLRMLAFRPALQAEANAPIRKPNLIKTDSHASTPMTASLSSSPETSAATEKKLSTHATLEDITTNWGALIPKLDLSGLALSLASNCTCTQINGNRVEFALTKTHEAIYSKKLAERIEQALTQYFNKSINLEIKITTTDIHTPAKQQQADQAIRQTNATDAIKNDETVQKIMDLFDAKLDESSIKTI